MSLTHKEKAKELIDKFYDYVNYQDDGFENNEMRFSNSKQCALIAIDEVIRYAETFGDVTDLDIEFYKEVKKEIENL